MPLRVPHRHQPTGVAIPKTTCLPEVLKAISVVMLLGGFGPGLLLSALAIEALPRIPIGVVHERTGGTRRGSGHVAAVPVNPFRVYAREGEPCPRCAGTIERLRQAGRSTFWCPACQGKQD